MQHTASKVDAELLRASEEIKKNSKHTPTDAEINLNFKIVDHNLLSPEQKELIGNETVIVLNEKKSSCNNRCYVTP